jgi:hypothetical protein
MPALVAEAQRGMIAEYLTRANYTQALGAFDMDFTDGEVRYRVAADVEGGQLGATMVRTMVRSALLAFDHYYPGLMRVIYCGMSPADAIASVEEKSE